MVLFGTFDDKNHTLNHILTKEQSFQADLRGAVEDYKIQLSRMQDVPDIEEEEEKVSLVKLMDKLNRIQLKFLQSEKVSEIPDDFSFFLQRNELEIESALNS